MKGTCNLPSLWYYRVLTATLKHFEFTAVAAKHVNLDRGGEAGEAGEKRPNVEDDADLRAATII